MLSQRASVMSLINCQTFFFSFFHNFHKSLSCINLLYRGRVETVQLFGGRINGSSLPGSVQRPLYAHLHAPVFQVGMNESTRAPRVVMLFACKHQICTSFSSKDTRANDPESMLFELDLVVRMPRLY
jgi:hypothetical protein